MLTRVFGALVGCLCLSATIRAQTPTTVERLPTGAISGGVIDAVTGRPVSGAVVSLGRVDVSGRPAPRVVTDSRGRFVFANLEASDGYYLGARRFGYAYTRYGWTAPNGPLTIRDIKRVKVASGQWVNDITIPLWRLASITGRVIDERDEPVVGVAVQVFSDRRVAGTGQLTGGPIATTDDRGVYRITDLEPGAYRIAVPSVQSTVQATTAEAPPQLAIGQLATGGIGGGKGDAIAAPGIDVDGRHRLVITNFATPPPPSSTQPRAYASAWYPGVRTSSGAVVLDVKYGDAHSAVDIQLQPVSTVRVSGRLEGGTETPRFLLRLMPKGSEHLGFGAEAATTNCAADGTFTFLNVPEGDYTLLAQASVMNFTSGDAFTRFPDAPGFPAGGIAVGSMDGAPGLGYLTRSGAPNPMWARVPVAVGTRSIDDLTVVLKKAVSIRGRVAFAAGVTPPRDHLLFHAHPANGDPSLGQPSGGTTRGDESFAFTLDGLLGGTYMLAPFSRFYIVSIVAGGKDVTYTGFDASAGRDFDDVVITVTDKAATISGRVSGLTGSSRTAAVIAFPTDRARWSNFGLAPPSFRTARASVEGDYVIEGLIRGEYYVVAVDAEQIDAWLDSAWLAQAAPSGVRISVDWGEKKEVGVPFAGRVGK